jgi:RPA family protein
MASSIRYEFELPKIAAVKTPAGFIEIGKVEEYSDNNGSVKVQIRFKEDAEIGAALRKELEKAPQAISLVGNASKPKNILILPGIVIPPG